MRKSTFKHKLFIAIATIVSVLMILGSIIINKIFISKIKEQDFLANKMIVDRISYKIDELYNEMDIALSLLVHNKTLLERLIDYNNFNFSESDQTYIDDTYIYNNEVDGTYIETLDSIRELLGFALFSQDISNVFLYNKDRDYLIYTGNDIHDIYNIDKESIENLYFEPSDSYANTIFLPPQKNPWSNNNPVVISAYKYLLDTEDIGSTILEVHIPSWVLDIVCTPSSVDSSKEIILLDDNYNLIYPLETPVSIVDSNKLSDIITEVKRASNTDIIDNSVDNFYKKGYSFLPVKSQYCKFNVVLISNNTYVNLNIIYSIIFTSLISIFIIIAFLFIIFYIIEKLINPLNELIHHFNSFNIDTDKKLSLSSKGVVEFNIINDSFNTMVDKLKESTLLVYEAEIREVEANLRALQSQVNPHFIHNTLNSISAASDIFGAEVTQTMCQQLSLMLRYTTSKDTEVRLIDEINHTKNYLELMRISHLGDFDYDIDICAEAYDFILPKLLIQPIVENSFEHGFIEVTPPWNISIKVEMTLNGYRIIIKDNGCGFNEESLLEFNKFKNSNHLNSYKELSIGGLGLKNLYSRLSILYNNNFSLTITYDKGCKVIIERRLTID